MTDFISAELNARLTCIATRRRYSDGQIIHSRGDEKSGLAIVRAGAGHVGTFGRDGSFVSISILGVGQSFGELTVFTGLPRTQDITSVGDTAIDFIPGPAVLALYKKEPELAHALMMIAILRSHMLLENITEDRRMRTPIRLAKALLDLTMKTDADGRIITRQSDLAATLGLSRYTVSKALKTFTEIGLIELGYGVIKIPDREALYKWAEQRSAVSSLMSHNRL